MADLPASEKLIGETFKSRDSRDDDRKIRIIHVREADGKLVYRTLVPSSVSPGTLVPNGRLGHIKRDTLAAHWTKVSH